MRFVVFLWLALLMFPVHAAEVQMMWTVSIRDGVRVVFDLNEATKYQYTTHGREASITFTKTIFSSQVPKQIATTGLIQKVKGTQIRDKADARFSLLFAKPVRAENAKLRSQEGKNRVQIDFKTIGSLGDTNKVETQSINVKTRESRVDDSKSNNSRESSSKRAALAETENDDDISARTVKTNSNRRYRNLRNMVIVLDPGHGGKDPGTKGINGILEKDVVLKIARKLGYIISAERGMKAVMTRNSDTFIPLYERVAIARRQRADLFVSIHMNWHSQSSIRGASVYALSEKGATTEAARLSEARENAVDLVSTGQRLDRRHNALSSVLLDLSQGASIDGGLDLAKRMIWELNKVTKTHKSAVDRANFVVLRAPDIPSVLIEAGFLSNPGEASNLNDSDYQGKVARAVFWAIKSYLFDHAPPDTIMAHSGNIIRKGNNSEVAQLNKDQSRDKN